MTKNVLSLKLLSWMIACWKVKLKLTKMMPTKVIWSYPWNVRYYKVLIGDMNINIVWISPSNNDYLNLLSENSFTSFINSYTRLPKLQNHSYLDHILFVHNNENIITLINAGILQTDITDHYAICISLPINNHLTNKSNYVSRFD